MHPGIVCAYCNVYPKQKYLVSKTNNDILLFTEHTFVWNHSLSKCMFGGKNCGAKPKKKKWEGKK